MTLTSQAQFTLKLLGKMKYLALAAPTVNSGELPDR